MPRTPEQVIAATDAALDVNLPGWRARFREDMPEEDMRPTIARVRGVLWLMMTVLGLGVFSPRPQTPERAAQDVCSLVLRYIVNTPPEAIAELETGLDARRLDWREKFTQDLPEGIDLRITVARVLGLLLLLTEGSPLDHVRSTTGQIPSTPEEAAQAMCAIFVRHLSGARLVS